MTWVRSTKCDTNKCVEIDMEFRKSSYSGSQGDNCVEVGATWTKSSFSGNNGSCVECTCDTTDDTIAVRDSKDPDGGILEFSHGSWNNFLLAVKAGDFDLLPA